MNKSKHFVLAVYVLLSNKRGQYLALKRSMRDRHNPGMWDLPGGKMEAGETLEEALVREAREETSLELTIEKVAGTSSFELPGLNVVMLIMNGVSTDDKVILSEEHEDYRWATLNEMQDMNFPGHLISFFQSVS